MTETANVTIKNSMFTKNDVGPSLSRIQEVGLVDNTEIFANIR